MANGNFGGGTGTPEDPYLVEDALDFLAIETARDAHYLQMNALDFFGVTWDPQTWWPPFTGSYNGQNYEITNMTINDLNTSDCGLFAYVEGVLENIILVDVLINCSDTAGALAAYVQGNGRVENCHASGVVTTTGGNTGGLIGIINNTALVTRSSSTCQVTGGEWGYNIGGFVGSMNSTDAVVEECYSTGAVTGYFNVGGFAGAGGPTYRCFSKGDVNANGVCGGFIGEVFGSITDCYTTGAVTLDDKDSNPYGGGFVGESYGPISKCYSMGSIVALNTPSWAKGFCGNEGTGSAITHCFYDSQTSGHTDIIGATPKTTAELKDQATYTGWDFETTWAIGEGGE